MPRGSARPMPPRAPRRVRAPFAFTSRTDCSSDPKGTGTAATYNYRHFLQLLAIKIRQREGVTLDIIKSEMKDTVGDALERRVAASLAAALGATVETRRQAADDDATGELETRRRGRRCRAPRPRRQPRHRATRHSWPCARQCELPSGAKTFDNARSRLQHPRHQRRAKLQHPRPH